MSASSQTGYHLTRVDRSRWNALRSEWTRLHGASVEPTFFLSAAWIDAWLAVYGEALDPEFVCFERSGELCGLALICWSEERRGPFRVRRLQFNTAGEGRDSPMLEHNALLCAADCRAEFAAALVDAMECDRWDELEYSGIRRGDWSLIENRCGRPAACGNWREAPYVDLERLRAAATPYLDTLSANTRHQIRRSMSLYDARGGLELAQAADAQEALLWFGELADLHEAVWRERGKSGAFASPRQRAFHEHVISAGAARGEAQILRVRAGTETVGVLYNLVHSGHVSYYQSGLRYETDNRLKPGLVCHALAIQRALETGYREYDFLAAANDGARYKQSLANASREFGWVTFRRDSLKIRVLDALVDARLRWQRR